MTSEHLRIYPEFSFNDYYLLVFCSVVRDSIGSHSEFLPRVLNSEFLTLEAYICFWVGHTTFLIKFYIRCMSLTQKLHKSFKNNKLTHIKKTI